MSIVLALETDDKKMFEQLLDIISTYDNYVADSEKFFKLEGVKIEEICRTLPKNLAIYDQYYQDMKSLEETLLSKRDKIQAKLWKSYLEGYPKALSAKDIQMYLQGDPEYVSFTEIILEVGNIKSKLQSIVKAFEQLGWMVGHIVKLRVAELQDAVL
jgi:hypothetical protein